MHFFKIFLLLLTLVQNQSLALADNHSDTFDGSFLDKPYQNLRHPTVTKVYSELRLNALRSNTEKLIQKQTPVKAQLNRGTCSIFSAAAILESLLFIKTGASLDLSEEWLEYAVNHTSIHDGSSSTANFNAISRYGMASEQALPYIGETWVDARYGLAATRCGYLTGREQKSCLIVHRNPRLMSASQEDLSNPNSNLYDTEFLLARNNATQFHSQYIKKDGSFWRGSYYVGSDQEIKELLGKGTPLTLDVDFYYGAWNHRSALDMGIGRDMDHWHKGIVGYPEERSIDRKESLKDPAGHSIVIVGYDDSVVVTTEVKMEDGSTQTFTHTGVYYFKNSWGQDGFGKDFKIGKNNYPGYGMITQDYAHEFGQFYKFTLLK